MSRREIKFRGIQLYGTKQGRWLYGSLIHGPNNDEGFTHSIYAPPLALLNGMIYVDPETVGQFTGFNDESDQNIYDGDIVQFTYWWFDGNVAESLLTGTIVYSDACMSFQLKGVKNKEWERHTGYENDNEYLTSFSELNFEEADFKVIGNIHENPELLETPNER